MALGSRKTFKIKDSDGNIFEGELKHLTGNETTEYSSEKFEYTELGMINHANAARQKWFDKLVKSYSWVYEDTNGNIIPFSNDNQIPENELNRLSEIMGMNGTVKTQLDIVPGQFKIDIMVRLFDLAGAIIEKELKKK